MSVVQMKPFLRPKPPQTEADVFRICRLDLDGHVRTVLAEALQVPEAEVPAEVMHRCASGIECAFLGTEEEKAAARAGLAADMTSRGFGFETYAADHQRLQTLMLGSLLMRTQRYLGLGREGADVFLRAMNGELMGVLRAFDALDDQAQAQERAALEHRLSEGLGAVLRGARDGDLSRRVPGGLSDPALAAIGSDLNALMDALSDGLRAAMDALDGLAMGRLDSRMVGSFAGDFAALQDNIATSISAMADILARIRTGAGQIAAASEGIRRQSSALDDRAKATRSDLRTLADGAVGMRDALNANRKAAADATEAMRHIGQEARQAGRGVTEASESMARIAESAASVQELADLIDAIAHQTHLLSLNAAVEAARAGDAGRGFAVVATEVRALATRVTKGAEDIRNHATENAAQVLRGRDLTTETVATLARLEDRLTDVGHVLHEVTRAGEVQADSFGTIETTVAAMSDTIERNLETSKEGVALSAKLSVTTRELTDLVERFASAEDAVPSSATEHQDRGAPKAA